MPHEDRYLAGAPFWVESFQPDPRAAAEFYGALLGWELRPVPGAPFSAWTVEDQPVGLLIDAGDTPQHWSLNFAVADADATARSATKLGGAVLIEPFDTEEHRNAVIADPAGAVIACSSVRAVES